MSESARRYVMAGEIKAALDIYSDMSRLEELTEEERANSILLYSITLWKRMNRKTLAVKKLTSLADKYKNTDAAGDALFFLGLISVDNGEIEKGKEFLNIFIKEYPGHIRYENARYLLKEWEALSKADNLPVRVLLKSGKTPVKIKSTEPIFVYPLKKVFYDFSVRVKNKSFYINGNLYSGNSYLMSSNSGLITVDGTVYKGKICILKKNDSMDVVNILSLGDYLDSVVPSEMPASWGIGALKAQAVVSRTYALYMMMKNRENRYDLKADTWSQVYKGVASENETSSDAVKKTESEYISFKGDPVLAAFHADSGGRTADPSYFWGEKYPYLNNFRDKFSPAEKWKVVYSLRELSDLIFNGRWKINGIKVLKRSPSGRVLNLMIKSDGGLFYVKGGKFREKIGLKMVRSTLFKIKRKAGGVIITGRGFGHGIGMSQYGARNMSDKGYDYKDIIKFYFSGRVDIVKKLPDSFKDEPGNMDLAKFF